MIHDFLNEKVKGFEVEGSGMAVHEALERLGGVSFQARNLNTSMNIYKKMLQDRCMIFLGIAGALIPAGLRKVFVHLIRNRMCDVIVSTGANLFHDCHESLGYFHYKGWPDVDDDELYSHKIDRIYDTFASEEEFEKTENFIIEFASSLEFGNFSTREFFYLLGKRLSEVALQPGIITEAYRYGVPIFCPAIADSSIGIALNYLPTEGKKCCLIDIIKDVKESATIVEKAGCTGVIYLGGGTPKNFIQQAALIPQNPSGETFAHRYAIQITMDQPQWGGLSGCTLKEAKSWGKIHKDANFVILYSEVTVAFPLLIQGIFEQLIREGQTNAGEMPCFRFEGEELNIEWRKRTFHG